MLPVRGLSRISRIVNLSFTVTGLKEQNDQVRALVSSVQGLVHMIIVANMMYRGLMMAMAGSPMGWLMLGVGTLGTVAMGQGMLGSSPGPTEFEEYRSRSPR